MSFAARRRALISASQGGSTPRLPDAYQEVEWIGVDGTQYIISNYAPSGDNPLKVETKFAAETGLITVFATRNYNSIQQSLNFYARNDTYNNYYYRQNATSSTAGINTFGEGLCTGGWDEVVITTNSDTSKTCEINGTVYALSVQARTMALNLAIFARNGTSITQISTAGKLAYLRFYETDDTLVHDYVPCYRKSDSVIGLYDLVTDTFLTNQGTGTFRKGGNV